VTLPPAQKEVGPLIVGVNALTVTVALPFVLQVLIEAVTLIVTGEVLPAEKVMDGVPWPPVSVPLVSDQVYVAPAVGVVMLAALPVLFPQTDAGALMAAAGGAQPMVTLLLEVLLLVFESVSVAEAVTFRTAVPEPLAIRLTVCVALALGARVPMLQVITVVPLQVPCVEVADPLMVTFAGSVIVAEVLEAEAGP